MLCRKIALSIVAVTAWLFAPGVPRAQQPTEPKASDPTTVTIDDKSIGGTVTSRLGPEAGVWIIAETLDLGTRFAKIVVTDERGRYVIPDLPKASYRVWVRGYGLVDSEKVAGHLGKPLNLTAIVAPSLAAAAQYYHWASMIRVPDKSRFPGTGDKGNGIPENFKTQEQWLNFVKTNGCGNCHQIGNYATRNIPAALGEFDSSRDAWSQRLSVGPAGHDMLNFITQLMTPDGGHIAALADWTDRVKAGELPSRSPPRPVGIERNLVITVRDWLDPKHYLHDLTTTDRRNPTINAYGPIYGDTELSTSLQPVLDPVNNTKTTIQPPVRDGTPSSALANEVVVASAYWGMEQTWDSKVNAHTSAMDQDGRVYYAAQNWSPKDVPDYCKKGSSLRSAQLYPLDVPHDGFFQNSRQVTVYDPKTKQFTMIDTCFGTHHLNFAEDADNTLWLSNNTGLGGAPVPQAAVVIRVAPGANPSETALTELYKIPLPGFGIRGMDVDRDGVAWLPLDSGHIASFDRRKCNGPLNGPGAEKGEKCPEGFSFYAIPGPGFQGDPGAEENPYFVWVDQHNILGLGANVPIATGNQSDSLHALAGSQIIELRVPYPMGFFAKGLEGRIDDPDAGWKGRELWVTSGNRTPFHIEGIDAPAPGAPGATPETRSSPLVVEFQLRPDPLAD